MGQSMGMLDFFVLEAGQYLERLDALAQSPAGAFPNVDEFYRLVRAWRGGALMASQRAMARAAQGLEAVSRSVRDGRVMWDERVRAEVIRAVDECKAFLHRIRTPAPEDAGRAEEIGAALERLAGRTSGSARAAGGGLDAGGRAFVAREAAAIASALDRAAQGLSADPSGRDALGGVAPAMSALRGVAVLNDLPPLPDLLGGIEGAIREVLATSGAVGPAVPAVFDAAAKAMARAAREVVDAGRPTAESEQVRAFTSLLLSAFTSAGPVVPIESLFVDDAGPHVVREGAPPGPPSAVEMVSQGEFLERAAEDLARAPSLVVRDLRLFGVATMLRPLAGATGSALATAVGRLADAGRAAIDRGAAAGNLDAFVAAVADAARTLRAAGAGDERVLAGQLDAASDRFEALASRGAAPAAATPAAPPRPRATREIPELAAMPAHPARPAPAVAAPAAASAPVVSAPAADDLDLAAGYRAMERMIAERGLPMGSLTELLGAPAEEAGVVPIEMLAPDEQEIVPIETLAPDQEAVVPIESLLYRGREALHRALELKAELAALTAAPGGSAPRLAELQREVFDLIELGLRAQP